ncbi:MAG: hypothetical protein IJN67_06170 [Oscillospiraceae bacterium]|nr:hypothetical protein [Oscillospiraceae bacterium]
MAQFRIKIAGTVFQVRSLFESTRDYCRQYLTEEEAECTIETCREDLDFEQKKAREEAELEGFRYRNFPDPYLERTAIQRKAAEFLFRRDVLVFHGSVVAVDGQGYLFTAKSGTGKSTHTRFWRQVFGDRAIMVNDDKPFLRFTQEGVLVCGSPWSGKHGLDTNVTVPLQGICILERGTENHIRRITPKEALFMLLQQSSRPLDPALMPKYLEMVDILANSVPLWQMECNLAPEAATVAHSAMAQSRN